MFYLYRISRKLNVPSVLYLLYLFELQREDWRQRPLPLEMVQYARIDSHYLLYIAKRLASELIEQDKGILSHFLICKLVIQIILNSC